MSEYAYAIYDDYGKAPRLVRAEIKKRTTKRVVLANSHLAAFGFRSHLSPEETCFTPALAWDRYIARMELSAESARQNLERAARLLDAARSEAQRSDAL